MTATRPKTVVLMFYPRFVAPIREGRKRQTIRPGRKYPPHPGDTLSLRHWSGPPYRSPQTVIEDVVCSRVSPLSIDADPWANTLGVTVGGRTLTPDESAEFARADGFNCVSDMVGYYRDKGTLAFDGILIEWLPL